MLSTTQRSGKCDEFPRGPGRFGEQPSDNSAGKAMSGKRAGNAPRETKPTSYSQSLQLLKPLERVEGIEPSYSAWKAAALPLSYTRGRRDTHVSITRVGRRRKDRASVFAVRTRSAVGPTL